MLVRPSWEHAVRAQVEGTEVWPTVRLGDIVDIEVRVLNSREVKAAVLDRIGTAELYPVDATSEPPWPIGLLRRLVQANFGEIASPDLARPRDAALARLAKALTIRAIGESGALLLSFRHTSPDLARRSSN